MTSGRTGSSTISTVIPVRDGEAFIEEAIDSVLGQTVPPDEVIVVDDGSRDATVDVVARFGNPVRLVRQEPRNQSAALNRGITEAMGALLSFCDADDIWTHDKLERQLDVLWRDPDVLLVSGLVQQFVSPGVREATLGLRVDTSPQIGPLSGTLLARREAFARVGDFDEAMHLVSGVEWVARARSLGLRIEVVDAVVLLRRVHGQNVSLTQRDHKDRALLTVLRAHRRRGLESASEG